MIKPCIYELFWGFVMVRCNVIDLFFVFMLSLFYGVFMSGYHS